jgi:hypothetical protein
LPKRDGQPALIGAYEPYGIGPWFFDVIQQTHIPTRIYENVDWQLVWFEYVGDESGVVRPAYAWDRLGPLPPDVLVDGTPLSETAHPEVWAVFGEGWRKLDPALGGRVVNQRATLWVYSPEAHTGQVRLTAHDVPKNSTLQITVDGGATTQPVPLRAGQPATAMLTLKPGWNLVTLTVQPQREKSDTAASAREGKAERDRGERGADRDGAAGTPSAGASGGVVATEPGGKFIIERFEIVTEPVA